MIPKLKARNPELSFLTIDDDSNLFRKIKLSAEQIISLSDKIEDSKANQYIPSDVALEELDIIKTLEKEVFAELPIQAGWCYGANRFMNAFEWHKTSEVVVACSDCLLLLGDYKDIIDETYNSEKAVALVLEKGQAVELMPLTLHFAPLPIEEFFKVAIILVKKTNLPLASGIDGSRRAINKWMLVHADNIMGVLNGGKVGIIGENLNIK